MNGILIIAHAPLAQAMRACAMHVFPESANCVTAVDVQPHVPPEESLASAKIAMAQMDTSHTLVLTDIFGATPANVAHRLVDGVNSRLVAGLNLPMLLRVLTYRHEPLDSLVTRAIAGGTQGIMQVAVTAPQNQVKRPHDQNLHDHQQ
jgi:PTS system ascorbate-specific IIA component